MLIMLSEVVAQVESANNPFSMRFEPAWIPHNELAAQKYATGGWIDEPTAAMICKTSWGKYQIMGDNLYGQLGYDGSLVDYLISPIRQLKYFQSFLRTIGFSDVDFSALSNSQLDAFAMKYNGSAVYADSLRRAYVALGG